MKIETIEKANYLVNKLKECKENLSKIKYTQNEGVEIRTSVFVCNGIQHGVEIPKSLFRVVGKLIESEYINEIDKIQKELDKL